MELRRKQDARQLISLVPMIDVMLILLVFFMVTSTYLNLDMIPLVETSETQDTPTQQVSENSASMVVRIGADGGVFLRGAPISRTQLNIQVAERLKDDPLLSVVIFPSSQATTQALVSTMDVLTNAGASRLRLVRLAGAE